MKIYSTQDIQCPDTGEPVAVHWETESGLLYAEPVEHLLEDAAPNPDSLEWCRIFGLVECENLVEANEHLKIKYLEEFGDGLNFERYLDQNLGFPFPIKNGSSGVDVKINSSNTQLDPELLYEDGYINAALDTFFNDEEKLGIIFEDEGSYINLYANYCPDTDVLEMYYIIHSDDKV